MAAAESHVGVAIEVRAVVIDVRSTCACQI